LKIDRSFIDDVLQDKDDVAIVQAIMALGKSLNLDLIAEGVETEEQRDFLVNKGCTHMQGHYFSYPVFSEEIKEKWLSRN